ncbi:MAG TPA: hypothetical protein VIK91_17035, partial [Nannocystis sp.]
MTTVLRQTRTPANQPVARFTGEGAYHGSTRLRPDPATRVFAHDLPDEIRPRTLERYAAEDRREIAEFEAVFPNRCDLVESLPVPAQDEIQADRVTFCWCPLDLALREAGPLTRRVLEAMSRHLTGARRHVYVDSKIQHFEPGDVPVDSRHWHIDGSIVARDERVRRLGFALLHDMRARLDDPDSAPRYLAYQSSAHCATLFLTAPLALSLPELVPDFDELDRRVRALAPPVLAQPPGSIVRFDGLSLHRA